jgi:MFS family permease
MSAFGLNAFALNFGLLVGPLIGGALIVPFGIGGVLIVPGILYGVAALLCVGLAPKPVGHDARRTNVLASLVEGLRYVRDDPSVRWLMLLFTAGTLLVRPYADLLPAVATSIGADAIGLAQLVAAVGGGSMLAGFVTASADAIPRKGVFVSVGFAAAGLTLAALGMQREVLPAVALVALLSFFLMTSSGIVGALLQYATPDRLRGRVVGVQGLLLGGGLPVGTLALGALGTSIGIGSALALAGLTVAAFALGSVAMVAVLRGR